MTAKTISFSSCLPSNEMSYDEKIKILNDYYFSDSESDKYSKEELEKMHNDVMSVIISKIMDFRKIKRPEIDLFLNTLFFEIKHSLGIEKTVFLDFVNSGSSDILGGSLGVVEIDEENGNFYVTCDSVIKNRLLWESFKIISNLISYLVEDLLTIPHMLVNIKQIDDVFLRKINFDNFCITLEQVLKMEYGCVSDDAFSYEEYCAENTGFRLLISFLKKYNFSSDYIDKMNELFIELQNSLGLKKQDGADMADILVDYLLFSCVAIVQEEKGLLKNYPLLDLIFDEEGNLLSVELLFKKRLSMIENKDQLSTNGEEKNDVGELDKIYRFVFKSFYYKYGKNVMMEEINCYLNNVDGNDEFAKSILEMCNELDDTDRNTSQCKSGPHLHLVQFNPVS